MVFPRGLLCAGVDGGGDAEGMGRDDGGGVGEYLFEGEEVEDLLNVRSV